MAARERQAGGGMTLVVLAIMATVAVAVWLANRPPSPPGNVLLVGDSLFFQSGDELTKLVQADGWTVDVQGGIGAGIEGGGLLPADWVTYLAPIVRRERPEVVVIELGTNGCGPSCKGIGHEIDAVLKTVEEAQVVVWLTVRSGQPPAIMSQINRQIEAARTRWPNLEVAPMNRWFANRRDLLNPDGVHLNPAGQRFLAAHVRDVIRANTA